ncbi:hypothetical protein FEZ51_01995 [Pediococcus stilesii]|uniref:Uncharacterized protein n=1 Tax=Pediococcus stilesii TaxID=331679 RepID=A0A5R9BY77_9LACO|nr:hypothetical protein [Pediococcus stilesii]TLQ05455.1 hypothetical protein FEZ51_01995 [Pediococcus stilesii]
MVSADIATTTKKECYLMDYKEIFRAYCDVDLNMAAFSSKLISRKIADQVFDEKGVKEWKQADLMDNIKHLVFHKDLTDKQKITSLKMLLEDKK